MIQYFPFCSAAASCSYAPFGLLVACLMILVLGFMIGGIIRKHNEQLNSSFDQSTLEKDGSDDQLDEGPREAKEAVLSIGDRWVADNNLNGDTYGDILYDFCGLRNKVAAKIHNVNFAKNEFTISILFPNTNVTKIMVRDLESADFLIDEDLPTGQVMADVYPDINLCEHPDFDPNVETALSMVDWDLVAENLLFDLYMSQATYDLYFPSARNRLNIPSATHPHQDH